LEPLKYNQQIEKFRIPQGESERIFKLSDLLIMAEQINFLLKQKLLLLNSESSNLRWT